MQKNTNKGFQNKPIKKAVASQIPSKSKPLVFFPEEKLCLILLVSLIVLVIIIRTKFLMMPFERDEGAYSYYGKLFLEGKVPYKDFYEQKFPGIFYFYGLMIFLFGETVRGMHSGFIFINVATIILIYLTARKLFSPIAGIIAATTFAFVSLTPGLSGFTVQSEHGVALFTSIGLFFYALSYKSKASYYYFLMGIAFGCAFMVKTSGMFFVLWGGLMLCIDFLFLKEKRILQFFKTIAIYSGGVLLVIMVSLFIIYLKGSFKEMIFWAYTIPKQYVGKIPFSDGVKYFSFNLQAITNDHLFFWINALLAILLCLVRCIPVRIKLFGITLIFFSILPIVPGYYFYGHYWIQILPGLSILAGFTFYCFIAIIKNGFKIKSDALKYIYLSVFILLTLFHVAKMDSYYFKPNYEQILRAVYGNNPFPESMEIGKYINANAKPEDKIILMGSEPEIYFYTKKESPSRHAYFSAIVNNVPEHHQWQREFVSDVEKARPKYFIFFRHPISLFVQPNTDQYVFEWANKYINDNYNIVGIVDMIEGQTSNYVWNEEAKTYKPVSQNVIFILERKT